MANVEKLLHSGSTGLDLIARLNLLPEEDKLLKSAKQKIRDHLKIVIGRETKRILGITVHPRFFTQGSAAYGLLNRRAWMPPQRTDFDDGTYLPMTFAKGARPSQASAIFFKIVDDALRALVLREGWEKFEEKDTCSRVVISKSVHIDVPLYAIPDEEFARLTKAAHDRAMIALDSNDIDFMRSQKMKIDSWEQLPSEKVLLAHRKEDWIASDPRKIHEWFMNAVELYGEALQRQSRYLKAWRDHQKLDHVSSIILMTCAFNVFEELGQLRIPVRDDLMLLHITERLAALFAGEICNPAEDSEQLTKNWTAEQRTSAIKMATKMHDELSQCVKGCYIGDVAVQHLRAIFGNRIANRPDVVGVHAAAKAAVAAAPVTFVPAPAVGRSTTG